MNPSAAARAPEVAIVGLGVIGGSAALRLLQRGTAMSAYAESEKDRELAVAAGVSVAVSLDEAVRGTGLVLIAVPLDALANVARAVIDAARTTATILHASSLQRPDALGASPEIAQRLIGTHPLAGGHRTGFAAASAELYREAIVFVERRASARQREDAELFWSLVGAARIEYAEADAHDRRMSWMSHLPQLASTALAATLADGLPLTSQIAPGARDATRLAMSSLGMWQPILDRAPEETLDAVRALEQQIVALRGALERRDWAAVHATWDRARDWRASVTPGERV